MGWNGGEEMKKKEQMKTISFRANAKTFASLETLKMRLPEWAVGKHSVAIRKAIDEAAERKP